MRANDCKRDHHRHAALLEQLCQPRVLLVTLSMCVIATIAAQGVLFPSTNSSSGLSLLIPDGKQIHRSTIRKKLEAHEKTPELVWLMSFPNSGTSFTSRLVRKLSTLATATNYGEEHVDENGNSSPIYKSNPSGPFWEGDSGDSRTLPKDYILTKTHCGGRCVKCGPDAYIETPPSFLAECLKGKRSFASTDMDLWVDKPKQTVQAVKYEADLVKGAVHLFRSPFDNIVARFHLAHKKHTRANDTEWLDVHPNDEDGFHMWCKGFDEDVKIREEEIASRHLQDELLPILWRIPCHGDFFRYIQWHNLAFITTDNLDIRTHIVHYEDYTIAFDETASALMKFLKLEKTGTPAEFIQGKEYRQYFTDKQVNDTRTLMKRMASPNTWNEISRYFD
eukprot:scaffold177261_cov53-Attheya_sp.AAC.1